MSTSASPVTDARFGSLPHKSWTIAAWATVAAFSVVFTYVFTLALGLVLAGFGLLVTVASLTQLSFLGILLGAAALLLGVTVLWSMIPRRLKGRVERSSH